MREHSGSPGVVGLFVGPFCFLFASFLLLASCPLSYQPFHLLPHSLNSLPVPVLLFLFPSQGCCCTAPPTTLTFALSLPCATFTQLHLSPPTSLQTLRISFLPLPLQRSRLPASHHCRKRNWSSTHCHERRQIIYIVTQLTESIPSLMMMGLLIHNYVLNYVPSPYAGSQ